MAAICAWGLSQAPQAMAQNKHKRATPAAPVVAPAAATASASTPAKPTEPKPPENSAMSAQMFYQVLISEIRLRDNDAGFAYQVYLELAKRHDTAQLYQRSVDIALSARAGNQALAAANDWHAALPNDRQAVEYQAQILMALDRPQELAEPLATLIRLAPEGQRAQVVASVPRSLARMSDRKATAKLVDEVTQPWRDSKPAMAEAWAATSEAWLSAGDTALAHERLKRALSINPQLLAGGLLALDLMAAYPESENVIKAQLAHQATPTLRLAYARKLASLGRMAEAATQLEGIVAAQPDNANAWLTLGSVRIELKQLEGADHAIRKFLTLAGKPAVPATPAEHPAPFDLEQGYLRMAQISEMRKQWAQADDWLRQADPKGEKLSIAASRARMLVNLGRTADARAVIQAVPEAEPRDALVKISAESQVLRDANQLDEAYKVLAQANERFPNDGDLLYDQAMVAETLKRYDESERLLRKVMALQPKQANAFNALGYSLAERGQRLDEARQLITQALSLRPGDPFITDSLGWVEFRAGKLQDALKWLREAYKGRADAEIAAHLGEVLWTLGQKEEALRIWREGVARDPANTALKDTIKRLRAPL
jgi:Flp pilus assembly protein TadD